MATKWLETPYEIIPSGDNPIVNAQYVQCADERLDEVLRSIGNDFETDGGRISANETNIAANTTAISGLDSRVTILEEQGGGGGTSDYTSLTNKPQINGNVLSGNKTSAQLGLASASDIPSNYITGGSQTSTSSADGGSNVFTFTNANGTTSTFTVKNGSKGSQGIQGIQGEKGDTGAAGTNGTNGSNGVSCTHSWSGTTLSVTSASGTSSANLKGEKGDKGDTGSTGPQGPAGSDANCQDYAKVGSGITVAKSVPADAVFTDTNTWRPLGTGASDACAGNDSRLSDARPANGGVSDSSYCVNPNGNITYGANRLQFKDLLGEVGNDPTKICNPFHDWFHHIVMNHGNGNGYYFDVACCFHQDYIYYRRIVSGTDGGWVRLANSSDIPTKVSQLTNDSGFTTNSGTVTSVAVKMNGSTKGTVTSSGTIDLGTVITSHQSLDGKQDVILKSKSNIKTGSSGKQKISFETLFAWLISQGIITSNTYCERTFRSNWDYANNDVLQITANGINYEIHLAGCEITFVGTATAYNLGEFVLTLKSATTSSFDKTSGYTNGYNSTFEYRCLDSSGSSYGANWQKLITSASMSFVNITLASSSGFSSVASFPDGFNAKNCVAIPNFDQSSTVRRCGLGITDGNFRRQFVHMDGSGIKIYNEDSGYYSNNVVVLLIKT